ncbi:two component transcriptional regulator, LuxR family [Lishizhenia tianjinensis]|uniref:Two component transcriptional regulator, LuxR family n=1 Tax=Lishizhenia tianjinensis TaxID=477690 RepID=A0A1I6Y9T0_9FLAO|nr:response regulator transcription factor [Lishizhenia tianjinensis]SFT47031.1 two component transcriptional regulator, LuxR family [Lishizhenia tianjinensis]
MKVGFIGTNEVLEIGLSKLIESRDTNNTVINLNTVNTDLPDIDLLFIDFGSDRQFATEKLAQLTINYTSTPIMLYVSEHNLKTVKQLLSLGVQSVMTYECDFDEIYESLESILKGGKVYCNKVLEVLLEDTTKENTLNCLPVQLSKREIEVLQLVVNGYSSKQIAEELFLSYHTINTHRKNILKKVGVKSVSELVLFAQSTGLMSLENT